MHEWDGTTPLDEMLSALDTLMRQGKIRYVGCSNYSGWHIMKALHVAEMKTLPRFITQQIHYTLEAREAEYELLPISVEEGLGVMDWSPLAAGLLSGRIPSNFQIPLPLGEDELSEDEDPITQMDLEELGLLTPGGKEDE